MSSSKRPRSRRRCRKKKKRGPVTCWECKRKFANGQGLAFHKYAKHNGPPPYYYGRGHRIRMKVCRTCKGAGPFRGKKALDRHYRKTHQRKRKRRTSGVSRHKRAEKSNRCDAAMPWEEQQEDAGVGDMCSEVWGWVGEVLEEEEEEEGES